MATIELEEVIRIIDKMIEQYEKELSELGCDYWDVLKDRCGGEEENFVAGKISALNELKRILKL